MGKKLKTFCLNLLHRKYLWTIVVFIAIVGFLDPNSFWHSYQLYVQNEALRSEIRQFEQRYEQDTKELHELENNPEAVERVARVNLYMRTANEDVYVLDSGNEEEGV